MVNMKCAIGFVVVMVAMVHSVSSYQLHHNTDSAAGVTTATAAHAHAEAESASVTEGFCCYCCKRYHLRDLAKLTATDAAWNSLKNSDDCKPELQLSKESCKAACKKLKLKMIWKPGC
eukprot:GFYU01015812.1.p1 GENE.GFYU01015812.1~~GFYU01015812.1.p1  ORF type:complete len:118 (-),score=22.95 GFYU01015812.1:227-580(-)